MEGACDEVCPFATDGNRGCDGRKEAREGILFCQFVVLALSLNAWGIRRHTAFLQQIWIYSDHLFAEAGGNRQVVGLHALRKTSNGISSRQDLRSRKKHTYCRAQILCVLCASEGVEVTSLKSLSGELSLTSLLVAEKYLTTPGTK